MFHLFAHEDHPADGGNSDGGENEAKYWEGIDQARAQEVGRLGVRGRVKVTGRGSYREDYRQGSDRSLLLSLQAGFGSIQALSRSSSDRYYYH